MTDDELQRLDTETREAHEGDVGCELGEESGARRLMPFDSLRAVKP